MSGSSLFSFRLLPIFVFGLVMLSLTIAHADSLSSSQSTLGPLSPSLIQLQQKIRAKRANIASTISTTTSSSASTETQTEAEAEAEEDAELAELDSEVESMHREIAQAATELSENSDSDSSQKEEAEVVDHHEAEVVDKELLKEQAEEQAEKSAAHAALSSESQSESESESQSVYGLPGGSLASAPELAELEIDAGSDDMVLAELSDSVSESAAVDETAEIEEQWAKYHHAAAAAHADTIAQQFADREQVPSASFVGASFVDPEVVDSLETEKKVHADNNNVIFVGLETMSTAYDGWANMEHESEFTDAEMVDHLERVHSVDPRGQSVFVGLEIKSEATTVLPSFARRAGGMMGAVPYGFAPYPSMYQRGPFSSPLSSGFYQPPPPPPMPVNLPAPPFVKPLAAGSSTQYLKNPSLSAAFGYSSIGGLGLGGQLGYGSDGFGGMMDSNAMGMGMGAAGLGMAGAPGAMGAAPVAAPPAGM